MKKDKKIIILISALVLILVFVAFLVSFLSRDNNNQEIKDLNLTAEQKGEVQEVFNATEDDLTMETRKIKLEIATDEELTEMGIVPKAPDGRDFRLQVIERDQSGKIISYKVIYEDEDIATEISVPKRGYFTEGGVVPFLEE
ncbi:MAG: hypothetical protein ACOYJ1_11390 [Peptococcales bacterium]|jgi:flagellar basal body-associated protein FliL|nr:MAG: hypothetical protein JST_0370 [Candidatus Parcubacteria bacterium]